jgi:hypothetical protein
MKNIYLSLISVLSVCQLTYAQSIFPTSGANVGIGTASPTSGLTVQTEGSNDNDGALFLVNGNNTGFGGGATIAGIKTPAGNGGQYNFLKIQNAGGVKFLINGSGNVGIGTTNIQAVLNVYQSIGLGGTPQNATLLSTISGLSGTGNNFQNNIWLVRNPPGSDWYTTRLHDGISIDGSFQNPQINTATWWERDPSQNIQSWGSGNLTYLTINNGNVLIGQTTQINSSYKLDVNGTARAKEVVVNALGSDFVFDPAYKLYPLSFVKKYIDLNHHLPEIPSAKQMQTNGLLLGDNQMKLLQKVEELTLYTIAADKKIGR